MQRLILGGLLLQLLEAAQRTAVLRMERIGGGTRRKGEDAGQAAIPLHRQYLRLDPQPEAD